MKSDYLEAGRFGAPHGVKGDLRAECWCDSVEVLKKLHTLYIKTASAWIPLKVSRCVPYKDQTLIHVEGYDTPEKSSALKNKIFHAARADLPALPEGRFYIADLLGLPVTDADTGRQYGVLKDVSDGAASQLYEIETPEKKTVYLPVVPQFVVRIDPDEAIFVRPVKGLFDEI